MSQHFLENIKIENFKCFENLEINDFKRVNVFGGKNNVGKTALLEAFELLVKSIDSTSLTFNLKFLLKKRQSNEKKLILDIFNGVSDSFFISSNIRVLSVRNNIETRVNSNGFPLVGISFSVNGEASEYIIDNFMESGSPHFSYYLYEKKNKNYFHNYFIPSSKSDENSISTLYGAIIESGKEDFLNTSLNNFDKSILSFKIVPIEDEVIPKFKVEGRDKLVPLSEMGDGVNRYIAILCAIWASQNGFLFIDEIENGIHYSNYKKLWELIFMASEQANCQVFVTSHSKECITAFNDVQQERADDAGRYFELYRSQKKQRIVAAVRDAEQLHYSLTHGAAIRGE